MKLNNLIIRTNSISLVRLTESNSGFKWDFFYLNRKINLTEQCSKETQGYMCTSSVGKLSTTGEQIITFNIKIKILIRPGDIKEGKFLNGFGIEQFFITDTSNKLKIELFGGESSTSVGFSLLGFEMFNENYKRLLDGNCTARFNKGNKKECLEKIDVYFRKLGLVC